MKRRRLLKLAAGTGVAGSTLAGGYLVTSDRGACGSGDYRWCYGVKGRLDAVSNGTVFVREWPDRDPSGPGGLFETGPTANGEIVALDAETGEVRWTYGEAVGSDSYTELAVADALYFGYCTDEMGDCSDLTALERDGEVRWTRDVNPGPYRPFVADDVVYVAEYSGPVRAHDAATGETRWERDVDGERTRLSHVSDAAVYAETDADSAEGVVALDRETGDRRWRYEPDGDQVVTGSKVADGIAYVVTFDQIAAVDGGDELWRRSFEPARGTTNKEIEGIESGRLFLLVERERAEDGRRRFRLDAIDVATGEPDWSLGPISHSNEEYSPRVAARGETVYVGTDRLRALDATNGEERWSASLDGGPILSATVVEAGPTDDHSVFAHGNGGRLVGFAPDGDRTWTGSVPGEIARYRVDESVVVSTGEAIYGLDR